MNKFMNYTEKIGSARTLNLTEFILLTQRFALKLLTKIIYIFNAC